LKNSEQCGTGEIKLEAKSLVDGDFQGGCSWPSAQSHDDGKTGEAQREHQCRHAGQYRFDGGPVYRTPQPPAAEPKLRGGSHSWRGYGIQSLQQDSGRQWRIEEHVGEQNAVQPIKIPSISRNPDIEQAGEPALPTKHRYDA
jgi:hypothetical protein